MPLSWAQYLASGVPGTRQPIIEVVDSHMHLLSPETHSWIVAKQVPAYGLPQFKGDVAMATIDPDARMSVKGCVHVQANFDGEGGHAGETAWLNALDDALPSAIVAGADLELPADEVEAQLAALAADRRTVGVRQMLDWHETNPARQLAKRPDLVSDPALHRGVAALAAHGLSFDLQVVPSQLRAALELVRAAPDTLIVLDHCGCPPAAPAGDEFAVWAAGVRALATERASVVCKLSGFGMSKPGWTAEHARPYVRVLLEAFGARRLLFGSNLPVDKFGGGSLGEWVARMRRVLQGLGVSRAEEDLIFGGNARRVYLSRVRGVAGVAGGAGGDGEECKGEEEG